MTEARTGSGDELYGDARTLDTVRAGGGSAYEMLDGLLSAVDGWAAGAQQSDGITLLAVQRLPLRG